MRCLRAIALGARCPGHRQCLRIPRSLPERSLIGAQSVLSEAQGLRQPHIYLRRPSKTFATHSRRLSTRTDSASCCLERHRPLTVCYRHRWCRSSVDETGQVLALVDSRRGVFGRACPQDPSDEPASACSNGSPPSERHLTAASQHGPHPANAERSPHERLRHHRPEALELLQRPPRRRPVVPGLHRAADVPAVPEDGRRADASRRSAARQSSPMAWTGPPCIASTAMPSTFSTATRWRSSASSPARSASSSARRRTRSRTPRSSSGSSPTSSRRSSG